MKKILKLFTATIIGTSPFVCLTSCSKNNNIETFTINFETNGGTQIVPLTIEKGGKIQQPNQPVKENFIFMGWFSDIECKQPYDFDKSVESNLTLYAGWTEKISQIIFASEYCDSTGKEDCADKIQTLIDSNPNRLIFFSDGTYLLSHPIKTYSSPEKSVSLLLSNYAVLKATDDFQVKRPDIYVRKDWEDEYNYMVQLGVDRSKSRDPKANYTFKGGVIDGNGKACGLEITGGLEDEVASVNIKNTEIGLRIAKGCNGYDSADANVHDINIHGNNSDTSIGLLSDAADNEITNIRSVSVHTGVMQRSGGNNYYTNVHCVAGNLSTKSYNTSVGFWVTSINWFIDCYSDCFHIGWDIYGKISCYGCVSWFHKTASSEPDIGIYHHTNMNSFFFNYTCRHVEHEDKTIKNKVLALADGKSIAEGKIYNILLDRVGRTTLEENDPYHDCLKGYDMDY